VGVKKTTRSPKNKSVLTRSRSWEIFAAIRGVKFFLSEKKLILLTKKILRLAEAHAQTSYLPPRNVSILSLVICSDREIHKLNKAYRNKDKPTDVLSFSQIEGEAKDAGGVILGDIVISSQTLTQQAVEYKVTKLQELQRLLVHGTLHLFGYDHENVSKKERYKMEKLEDKILGLL
jgi:probable rRNA maturation factor